MIRRERRRAYRRLKRVRSDIRVTVKKISRSHGRNIHALERRVSLLTRRKRKLKKRFARLKERLPKQATERRPMP